MITGFASFIGLAPNQSNHNLFNYIEQYNITYCFTPQVLTVLGAGWLFLPPVIVGGMMVRGLQVELRESKASGASSKVQAKNISLAEEHIGKIKSYAEKNNSNFSAAIREIIQTIQK